MLDKISRRQTPVPDNAHTDASLSCHPPRHPLPINHTLLYQLPNSGEDVRAMERYLNLWSPVIDDVCIAFPS